MKHIVGAKSNSYQIISANHSLRDPENSRGQSKIYWTALIKNRIS